MTEYITKEQANRIVESALREYIRTGVVELAFEELYNLPDADVAPVVHAENITNAHPSDEFECSNCGLILREYLRYDPEVKVHFEFTDWNFCPQCGARMDGEKE